MDIPIFVWTAIAGCIGGAVLGSLTYLERMQKGEAFEKKKFALSMLPPTIVGLASGFLTTDFNLAFTAGLVGKKVWDTATKFV